MDRLLKWVSVAHSEIVAGLLFYKISLGYSGFKEDQKKKKVLF